MVFNLNDYFDIFSTYQVFIDYICFSCSVEFIKLKYQQKSAGI